MPVRSAANAATRILALALVITACRPSAAEITVPPDVAPASIDGEVLHLLNGGTLPAGFVASNDSLVVIAGGVAEDVVIDGSRIHISGGSVESVALRNDSYGSLYRSGIVDDISVGFSSDLLLQNSVVGELKNSGWVGVLLESVISTYYAFWPTSQLSIGSGYIDRVWLTDGQFNIVGGSIGPEARLAGQVQLRRGSIGVVASLADGRLIVSDGHVGRDLEIHSTGELDLIGGSIGRLKSASAGALITVAGTAFEANGNPIEGLVYGVPKSIESREVTLVATLLDGQVEALQIDDRVSPDASVRVVLGLEGDFNADGEVDAADYSYYRDNLGDRFVREDLAAWKRNYQFAVAPGIGFAIPEPSTAFLALLALGPASHRRR